MKTDSQNLPAMLPVALPLHGLCIPEEVLRQHAVVLGKTGAGKSSKLRHIVEHLLKQGKRVCIVDPKGDWWGLKKSADGKSAGFPLIAFGDFKEVLASDVPINAQSGRHVAELITSGNRPCILGFRGWMPGQLVKFWLDFAPALFNAQSGELYLVIDEVHNFAPKGKILDPEAGKCIHWTNRLMSEGRGLGLICFIASQRPQKVHNDTLTCCETLIAARVIHKADRSAVKDWIDGCGDGTHGNEVLNGLAQLERPEAWVWSPEAGFGPQIVKFPLFTTFDSFAPPQLQKKISAEGWSTVNLAEVKAKLATVIEEAKANDPAELKRTIAGLKKQLNEVSSQKAVVSSKEPEIKEVPVLKAKDLKLIEQATNAYEAVQKQLGEFNGHAQHLADALNRLRETKFSEVTKLLRSSGAIAHPLPQPIRRFSRPLATTIPSGAPGGGSATREQRPTADENGNGDVPSGGLKRMMVALAQRPGLNKRQLGVRAGLSSTSGTFGTYLGKLRSSGWIEGAGDSMTLTDAGVAALGNYQPLPEGADLLNHWLNELGNGGAGRMLQALADIYPESFTKEQLGAQANISHTSGTFGTYLGKLRTLELVEGKSELRAAREFFEP